MLKRIIVASAVLSALSAPAFAQTKPTPQELLLQLQQRVNNPTVEKPSVKPKALKEAVSEAADMASTLSATGIKVRSLISMSEPVDGSTAPIVDLPVNKPVLRPHEAMPLRELPVGSRFSFTTSIYFPANTNARIYVDGAYESKVYSGTYPSDELFAAESGVHSACAIKSSKGHVKLKGTDESTSPTFIDFNGVSYIEDGSANRYLFTLKFEEKRPAGADTGVGIELTCLVPKSKNPEIPSLKMSYLYDAFPSLFTIEIPEYVEL